MKNSYTKYYQKKQWRRHLKCMWCGYEFKQSARSQFKQPMSNLPEVLRVLMQQKLIRAA